MEIALDEGAKIRNLSQLIVLLRTSNLFGLFPGGMEGEMSSRLDLTREKFYSSK